LSYRSGEQETASRSWAEVWNLSIGLPTSPLWGFHTLRVLSILRPFDYSPREVEVGVEARLGWVQWPIGRDRPFSWRLAFILDEVTELLARRKQLHLHGRPGFLDQVSSDLVPRVPAHARLMVRTDTPGLNRKLAGHGAYDERIGELVERWTR
jgi:hypothetical protein